MGDNREEFRRINFFRGFLTTEDDWNDAEAYHVGKRQLHNQAMHGPGVVPHVGEGLRVVARGKGELAVEVRPGYALDGSGHDIVLPEAVVKTFAPSDFEKLPATVFVVLKYIEEPTHFIKYRQYPDYKGHRRIAERARVDLQVREPEADTELELARLVLTPDARRVTDARDPSSPGQNEIDLRFVPLAGSVGTRLSSHILHELRQLSALARRTFAVLAHEKGVASAGAVLHAYVTFEMLLFVNLIDQRSFFEAIRSLLLLENDVIREVERRYPDISKAREFYNFKDAVRRSLGEWSETSRDLDFLRRLVGYQEKACRAFEALFEDLIVPDEEAFEQDVRPTDELLERLFVWSAAITDTIDVDDVTLKLVDFMDLLDTSSETAHKFKIMEERDRYRSRQKLKYPDGTEVEDTGVAFEGGYCEFEVADLAPHKDVILLMRMDYVHGDWKADVLVNGEQVGVWECVGDDKRFRWRNLPFVIDARNVNDTRLMVRVRPTTADRDINMFKLWALQAA